MTDYRYSTNLLAGLYTLILFPKPLLQIKYMQGSSGGLSEIGNRYEQKVGEFNRLVKWLALRCTHEIKAIGKQGLRSSGATKNRISG